MIANTTVLEEQRRLWDGVRLLWTEIHTALMSGMGPPGSFVIFAVDAAHNLPFVHACSVLNNILEALRDEGHFSYQGRELGGLVRASQKALPWRNYPLIRNEVVQRRNDLVHRAAIVPCDDCGRYIDAIEAELIVWSSVLPASPP